MKIVLTFGSFDHVHDGHLYYLKEAKKHGEYLIVVIARDKTIEKIKGKKPKYPELERVDHVQSIPFVDKVILGGLDDPYAIIGEIKPDVICLGYDQFSFSGNLKKELKKRMLNPEVYRISAYKEHIYKSSKLK